ncbi:MAG: 2OG-Fe(II) oxygenase [Rubrivivax sp.]|jgi:prolyl 4-hydroxylase|nr:2OG-Fe(II) oxygenase [Rubrivivax sp.]
MNVFTRPSAAKAVQGTAAQHTGTAAGGQQVTPELKQWLEDHLQAGTPPAQVIEGMVGVGWQTALAWGALAQAQAEFAAAQQAAQKAHSGNLPEPDIADGRSVLDIEGHRVKIATAMKHPRVVVFEGLLTLDECQALVDLSSPRLARSETVDNSNGGNEVNAARTSDGMFFGRGETPLIERIERRIALLLRWPVENGEGLQILRYRPGAEYLPHYDYFDPVHPGSKPILQRGGQRVGTLVMYLSAPLRGGATTFPHVGLEVGPVPGNAVFFSYDKPHPSTGTLHGGAPVLEGEKWVATKWMREGEFR